MFAPTHLTEADRTRLAEINQTLLTGITSEERSDMLVEQAEIMARRKSIQDCTFEQLHELRQQLYDQYQKHSAIGSKQTLQIARYLQQVEMREYLVMQNQVAEPTKAAEVERTSPRGKRRVSTKQAAYSWTVPINDLD